VREREAKRKRVVKIRGEREVEIEKDIERILIKAKKRERAFGHLKSLKSRKHKKDLILRNCLKDTKNWKHCSKMCFLHTHTHKHTLFNTC
jgi:hypothetical protein